MSLWGKIKSSYGGWWSFSDTILPSPDRANVMFLIPGDSRMYINSFNRLRLEQKAEWLWQYFGIVKEIGAGIARHTVGKGRQIIIDCEDHDFAMAAEADFNEYAESPDRCDAAGRRNLYEAQDFAVQMRWLRGEFTAAHALNPRWVDPKTGLKCPCFQIFDSREVGSPNQAGNNIIDGVEVDEFCRPVRYFVRTVDGDYRPVLAEDFMHWFQPHANNQVRGITELAQAVNNLVDIHELKRMTIRTAKAHQLLALVMKGMQKSKTRGAFGAIKNVNVTNDPNAPAQSDTAQLEKLYGAAGAGIVYLDDVNGDVKLVESAAPSPLVEPFITGLLMRDSILGSQLPPEFFWNVGDLGGANNRFVLARADLLFQVTGERLDGRFNTPVAWRYINWRIKTGVLRPPKKRADGSETPWLIGWQGPARITVDSGRDGNMELSFLGQGGTTLRAMYARRGESWLVNTRQWFREWKLAKAIAAEEGVPEAFAAWRALMPGAGPTGKNVGSNPDDAGDPKNAAEHMDDQDEKDEQDKKEKPDPKKKPGRP